MKINPIALWWRKVTQTVDQHEVMTRVFAEGAWSSRYAFMILMSAGIAVLGLLLSSPAVVIGAMLISPLMNPILGLGFSLATFDFAEARRALLALAAGSILAVIFTTAIVMASPLKQATPEILSRTRPELFDLLVALFAALAGTFSIIKGGGGTIVGVAIATALMPPLAVVGFGLATQNVPVLGGALALFATNFVTIALSATIVARFYGFGASLSGHQSLLQTVLLIVVFVGLAIPLGTSLSRIASEAVTVTEIRSFLTGAYGARSRITQLAVDFDSEPIRVKSVVIAPKPTPLSEEALRASLAKKLKRPVALQVDQIVLNRNTTSLDAQREQLQAAAEAASAGKARRADIVDAVSLAAGVASDHMTVDDQQKRITAAAAPLPGADLQSYQALEQRAADRVKGWRVIITPPFQTLPKIRFANGSDVLDPKSRQAVLVSAWAAHRWNIAQLRIPGLPPPGEPAPRHPSLDERRAIEIATLLKSEGISASAEPPAGRTFTLSGAPEPNSP